MEPRSEVPTRMPIVAWVLAAALLGHGGLLGAQTRTPSEVAQSREQVRLGVEAATAGRWEDARMAFERAYAVVPQPLTLLNLAGAQAQTGRLIASAENYRRFLREPVTANAARYRADAETALAAVENRLAHLEIAVDAARDTDQVQLDGVSLAPAALAAALPVDPGAHALVLLREGAIAARANVTLREGESRRVGLRAESTAPSQHTVGTPAPVGRAARATPSFARARTVPSTIGQGSASGRSVLASPWFWGVTAVLLVAGGVTAVAVVTRGAESPYEGSFAPSPIEIR